jgi:hypothetical protein
VIISNQTTGEKGANKLKREARKRKKQGKEEK